MKNVFNFFVSLFAFAVSAVCGRKATTFYTKLDPVAGANVYSAEYNNMFIASPAVKQDPSKVGGRKRVLMATYNQGSTAGNIGDVIYFGNLPAGATVLQSKVFFSAHGGTATLALGVVGTPAKLLAATSTVTAGDADVKAHLAAGAVYKTAAAIDVIGTNAASAIPANGVVTVILEYVLD